MKALGAVIWWLAVVVSAAIFATGVWFAATKLSGAMAVTLILGASLKAALILAMGYFARYLWDRQAK
jgi:hypothetical protein